jgi:cell division protein FtsI/penicillin-binding protein 2
VRTRFLIFSAAILSGFGILLLRCWQLQVHSRGIFEEQALRNQIRTLPVNAERGLITDRYGAVIAGNRSAFSVTLLDPSVPVTHRQLRLLASILGCTVDTIKKKFKNTGAIIFIRFCCVMM